MSGKSEYELALKITGMVEQSLGAACTLTKKQIKELSKEAVKANTQSNAALKGLKDAGPGIDAAWGGLKKTVQVATKAMVAAGTAAAAASTAAIGVGRNFEAAMSSWAATASATEEDYRKAEAAAMEMGRKTSKTASESANALEYMALAGWSVEDSIKGLPGILRLSEASGLDLARTSDLVTDSMSAAGVTVDQLAGYLDIAAMANNKSNQTAEQLMEAFIGVGGVMHGLNVPIEETAAALGMMANRGIKGSEAGNALSAIMANLTTGTGKAGKMMDKIGLHAFDAEGKFKGLRGVLEELTEITSEMTEEERNATLAAIGGKQHIDALNDLMAGLNTEVSEGVTEWDALADALGGADGALERMAATKMDNLAGDMQIFASAAEDAGIRFYKNFQEPLRAGVQAGTELIYQFSENVIENMDEWIPTIKRKMKEGGEAFLDFAGPGIEAGKWVLQNGNAVIGVLTGIVTTITVLKGMSTIADVIPKLGSAAAFMATNPFGQAALAAGAIVGIATAVQRAHKAMVRSDIASRFGDITLSLEDLQAAAKQILGANTLDGLARSLEEIGKTSDIADTVSKASDAIEKLTWKVGMGYQLTGSDADSLKTNIDTMIEQSLATIQQAQFTAHISVAALFGEGDETGDALIAGFDSMYSHIGAQVEALGEQLGKAYNDAMEDGIIDTDEAKLIQELQAQLARVTSEVSQAQFDAKMDRIMLEYSGAALTPESFQNLQAEIQEQLNGAKDSARTAYEYDLGALKLRLSRSENGEISPEDAEYLTQAGYNQLKAALDKGLRGKEMELDARGIKFSTDAIESAYGDVIEQVSAKIPEIFEKAGSGQFQNGELLYDYINQTLGVANLDATQVEGIRSFLDQIRPQIDEMQTLADEARQNGEAIPQALADALASANMLEAITGNTDAMYDVLGQAAAENESYQQALDAMQENGQQIPEYLAQAIEDNTYVVDGAAETLATEAKSSADSHIKSAFSSPITANVELDLIPSITAASRARIREAAQGAAGGSGGGGVPEPRAHGGLVTEPEIAWIGEAGDSEMVIPINRSARSAALWQQAGQMLSDTGNRGASGGGSVVYAPNITIQGNADESAVRTALARGYDEFKSYMAQYRKDELRLSY